MSLELLASIPRDDALRGVPVSIVTLTERFADEPLGFYNNTLRVPAFTFVFLAHLTVADACAKALTAVNHELQADSDEARISSVATLRDLYVVHVSHEVAR